METFTRQEVTKVMECLWMYKFDYETKMWSMNTHLAPGMLKESSDQLLNRFFPLGTTTYYSKK